MHQLTIENKYFAFLYVMLYCFLNFIRYKIYRLCFIGVLRNDNFTDNLLVHVYVCVSILKRLTLYIFSFTMDCNEEIFTLKFTARFVQNECVCR